MEAFRKLVKQLLSFHISIVNIDDAYYYSLENMLYESNYNGEATSLRNDAITDLLFLDEKIREAQIMRLKNTLNQFNEYISKHLDSRNLVGELYNCPPLFNISINNTVDISFVHPITTINFSEDLNREISIRLYNIDVLINGGIYSINNNPFEDVIDKSLDDYPDVKYLNIIENPKNLREVPFEIWDKFVYQPDMAKGEGHSLNSIQRMRNKRNQNINNIEDLLTEKYSGRSSELINLIIKTEGPVANLNKDWIAPSYAANALFQVLLGYGIIKNVSKETFAIVISKEFSNLHNSFWRNKGGNDYEKFQKSFELSFSFF